MLYVLVHVFHRRVVACKPAGRHIYDDGTTPLFLNQRGYIHGRVKPLTFSSIYDAAKYRDLNYPDFSICHYDPRLNNISSP